MSLRGSPVDPQISTKRTSISCSQLAVSSIAPDLMMSCAENSNDSLDIEDLDLADLDISPSTVRTCSPMPTDGLVDEQALFREIDANNFFGDELPAVVSEACLMNDLYILVKIPSNPKNHVPLLSTASQTSPKLGDRLSDLRLKSNRIIFPIQEEEDEHSEQEPRSRIPIAIRSKPQHRSCWVGESNSSEEFMSKTNIVRNKELVSLPNAVPEKIDHLDVSPRTQASSSSCQNQIELQEVTLNSTQFKSHVVSLENYGILITPTKAPKTENLLVFQVDTEPKGNAGRDTKFSCFGWVTKFFRRKRRRDGCVQAKVYKTYFVKWKKCSEDTECQRCQRRQGKTCRRNSA